MKAVSWYGPKDVQVVDVPEPRILNPQDAIIKVTMSAICGSDLHLYGGYIPSMKKGDILGHEFMGEVVEVGKDVKNLTTGDRVVVPFTISCGKCFFCRNNLWSLCDNSNPNAQLAEKVFGYSGAAIYGYSHIFGGISGGQAEYVRVPFANIGPLKVDQGLSDEQVLFLSDILPTGYMAAENGNIQPGNVVAVWGCGPVGQFAIRSASLLGAERIIAIDRIPERLTLAAEKGGAETIDYERQDVGERLRQLTGGRGPDVCIDAVGLEAHGGNVLGLYDDLKQAVRWETDRGYVLRQIIQNCCKGGTVSIAGAYGGMVDKVPLGAAFNKGLTFKMGQTHVQKYMLPLLGRIARGEIDASEIITHKLPLAEAPAAYEMFRQKSNGCIKVVLKP
jgi:threonine dehydrogenase-like Zn-dependent dehydrogenase